MAHGTVPVLIVPIVVMLLLPSHVPKSEICPVVWLWFFEAKLDVVYPLSCIIFPVVPLNVAICPSLAVVGPTTAPSIFVCTTVQCVLLAEVLVVIQIIKSPPSQATPAYVTVDVLLTRYVSPTVCGVGKAETVAPLGPIVPLNTMASVAAMNVFKSSRVT